MFPMCGVLLTYGIAVTIVVLDMKLFSVPRDTDWQFVRQNIYMRRMSWLSLILLAGCGGTNTTDGMSSYNRGQGQDIMSPTSSNQNASAANEIAGVDAFLNATEIKDSKQASLTVDGLKKLAVPPKRVFLIGATLSTAGWFKKPLSDAKITPIPVPGPDVKDWAKVLKTLSSDKIYSNGPSMAGPNADLLVSDQSKLSSTAVYDGVRFFFLNTDTPLKGDKPGSIARLWFLARQTEMKENSAIVVGYRSVRSLGSDDPTPVIATSDILSKNSKIKVFVSTSSKSPSLSRPDPKSAYHMAVGGAIGEDHLPFVGVIEVRKNGAIFSRITKLDVTKQPAASLEATIWEPTGVPKVDSKTAKDAIAQPVTKDGPKEPIKEPSK